MRKIRVTVHLAFTAGRARAAPHATASSSHVDQGICKRATQSRSCSLGWPRAKPHDAARFGACGSGLNVKNSGSNRSAGCHSKLLLARSHIVVRPVWRGSGPSQMSWTASGTARWAPTCSRLPT